MTSKVPPRRHHERRQLSCLPCRRHKLRCDRKVPCQSCIRYRRIKECGQNPAPEATLWTTRSTLPSLAQASPDSDESHSAPGEDGYHHSPEDNSSTSTIEVTRYEAMQWLPRAAPASPADACAAAPAITQVTTMLDLDSVGHSSPAPFPVFVSAPTISSILSTTAPQPHANLLDIDMESFWKAQLVALLPSRNQCDVLVAFYLENINYIYGVVHEPSFRRQYYHFWDRTPDQVDLIWLALLFTMISLSALYISPEAGEAVSLDPAALSKLAQTWHGASRQALYSGGFESRPRLLQLAVFAATQIYWLSMRDGEALNSCLGQAVRNAQALRLDRDTHPAGATVFETEMRRRLWWELCCCDTFQSLCYGRTPLIQVGSDRVPMPANSNDEDLTETSVTPRPAGEPSDLSASIARAKAFRLLRALYVDDGAHMSSWEFVRALDRRIQAFVDGLPWFFCQRAWEERLLQRDRLPPALVWQHHLLHISLRMQRLRVLRPFTALQPEAYTWCVQAVGEILDSYKFLRQQPALRRSPKFHIQWYQSYSAAVQAGAFLLVERDAPASLRRDIEMVIDDMASAPRPLPLTAQAHLVLRKMLRIYDRIQRHDFGSRGGRNAVDAIWGGGGDSGGGAAALESLAPDIAPVFGGGESTARRYLRRCDIGYLLNSSREAVAADYTVPNNSMNKLGDIGSRQSEDSRTEGSTSLLEFEASLDVLSLEQWDSLLQEVALNHGDIEP